MYNYKINNVNMYTFIKKYVKKIIKTINEIFAKYPNTIIIYFFFNSTNNNNNIV